jgi:hypothetical protein
MSAALLQQQAGGAAVVRAWVEAFERRDLAACVGFWHEEATIRFLFGTYQGRAAIERWHADRFAADVRIANIGELRSDGDTVAVDAEASSRRLKLFRIDTVKGTATFRVHEGRIGEARFESRAGAASHLDWQFR